TNDWNHGIESSKTEKHCTGIALCCLRWRSFWQICQRTPMCNKGPILSGLSSRIKRRRHKTSQHLRVEFCASHGKARKWVALKSLLYSVYDRYGTTTAENVQRHGRE